MAAEAVLYPARLRSAIPMLASSLVLGAAIVAGGCAHRVRLDTTPGGAEVMVNGVHMGRTPVDFKERSGWGKRYDVQLKKAGYRPVKARVRQTEWDLRVVGPSLPFLWCPMVWPMAMFSRRARHGYHWKLVPAAGAADPTGVDGGPAAPLPEDYPAEDAPQDYPPPPPDEDSQ